MSRRDWTPDNLRELADEVASIAEMLRNTAQNVEDSPLPTLFMHGSTPLNRYLPSLKKWAAGIQIDCETQIRAASIGVPNPAKEIAEQAASQRAKKKTTKKPA
jgi:hypothetical protein